MKSLLLLIPLLFLSGCSTKTVYVDRPVEVKVPIEVREEEPKSSIRKGAGYPEKIVVIKKYAKDSKAKFK